MLFKNAKKTFLVPCDLKPTPDLCLLTLGWPSHSRTEALWSRGLPGPASPRCWCWRRSEACWPASCSPRRSSGGGTRSPFPSAASLFPLAASWAPALRCRWPHPPGPCGGSGSKAHSSWTRRPLSSFTAPCEENTTELKTPVQNFWFLILYCLWRRKMWA